MIELPAFVISRVKAETPLRDDVQRRDRGADVEQRDGAVLGQAVLVLEDVLDGEGVDVDDDRLQLGLADDRRVVVDLVFLRGDEEEIHLPGVGPPAEDLVVDRHDLDVERDVLLGLPADLLLQLVVGHHRDGDLSDDHRLPVDADGDVLLGDLRIVEDLHEALDDGAGVHDVTVDDRLRWQGREPVPDDLELLPSLFQLHHLDGARADVDSDQVFTFAEHFATKCCSPRMRPSKSRWVVASIPVADAPTSVIEVASGRSRAQPQRTRRRSEPAASLQRDREPAGEAALAGAWPLLACARSSMDGLSMGLRASACRRSCARRCRRRPAVVCAAPTSSTPSGAGTRSRRSRIATT